MWRGSGFAVCGVTAEGGGPLYHRVMYPSALRSFYEGWANYQALVTAALRDLTADQLGLRSAPHQWAVWQLAAHIAGTRAYWFHDILGEGDASFAEMFRVDHHGGEISPILGSNGLPSVDI